MKRKEQYADEIIEILERTKRGAWASNINLNTKDRVIEVCQNCVDSWSGRKFKDHCTTSPQALEQTRWIPVSERLPEDGQNVLFSTKTDMVFEGKYYADTSAHNWLSYKDDTYAWNNVVTAWMPLPEPYKAESEGSDAVSN